MTKKKEQLKLVITCPKCGNEETVEADAALILTGKPGLRRDVEMTIHHLSSADAFEWLTDALRYFFNDSTGIDEDEEGEK